MTGDREPAGVLAQLRLAPITPAGSPGAAAWAATDQDVWTPTLCVRDPLHWNRWDTRLEHGAWFAGDYQLGGVLALPGGTGLMTVRRPTRVLAGKGGSTRKDHEALLATRVGQGT